MRNVLGPKDSLARRVITALVVGEIVFAVVLSITVGLFSLLSAAQLRADNLEEVSSIVAASLMPLVADQREEYLEAQLASILETVEVRAVERIRIVDASGATIAAAGGDSSQAWDESQASGGQLLLGHPIVERSLEVDGMEAVTVYVRFAPLGGWELLQAPVLSAGLLLASVVLVSVPWTVWRLTDGLVLPLAELRDSMAGVARGEHDVQGAAQAPAELRELEDTLRSMAVQLRERDEQLRASFTELEEAKRHIEGTAAVAAHEIRTPLALIRLQAEMLGTGEIAQIDEEGLVAIGTIRAAAARLTSIVSDLMDAALLERGMLPIDFGEMWLDEIAEDAVRDAATLARAREVSVGTSGDLPETIIWGDKLRLRQVLDNLLSNAVKHSPAGTIVTLALRCDDNWTVLEVADRGVGIPVEDLGRLFTLFGRLDQDDNRQTEGLGLGLAISKRVIEAHGGTIGFRANEVGQGSIFSVRLPRGISDKGARHTMIDVVD